jgi:hypothetical protein
MRRALLDGVTIPPILLRSRRQLGRREARAVGGLREAQVTSSAEVETAHELLIKAIRQLQAIGRTAYSLPERGPRWRHAGRRPIEA